jgi:hypothetical protein
MAEHVSSDAADYPTRPDAEAERAFASARAKRVVTGKRRLAPEKQVQADIVSNLQLLGFVVSSFSQARASMQTEGIPDIYAAHPGWRVAFWCEVKAGKNDLTPAQVAWADVHRRSGIEVIAAWSWSDVYDYLTTTEGVPLR